MAQKKSRKTGSTQPTTNRSKGGNNRAGASAPSPRGLPQHFRESNPFGGFTDPILVNKLEKLTTNLMSFSRSAYGENLDRRRDIEDECGYPPIKEPVPLEVFWLLYLRDAIASRVVEVLPKESWQVQPMVYEKENSTKPTEFEDSWDALGRGLQIGPSWHKQEEGSLIWNYLLRADILSGVGTYGVIYLGTNDGENPREPYKPVKYSRDKKGRKLTHIRVLPGYLAPITRFHQDPTSPLYGMPAEYLLTFNDPKTSHGGMGLVTATQQVHWTRIIHVADNLTASEIYGPPRMEASLNNILGLHTLYASSPEMFYKGAFPGLSLSTHPQLGGDVEVDEEEVRDAIEQYFNGLQRYILGRGMGASMLSPTVVDPTGQIAVQIEAICIKLGCPVRVFKGSERGELASSQDDSAWNDRLNERRRSYITPRIIVPTVDRLIWMGVLPEPEEYFVGWPDLTSQSASEKATIAVARVGAMTQYVSGGVDSLIAPVDFLVRELGYSEEEAESIIENSQEYQEEKQDAEMEQQQGMAGAIGQGAFPGVGGEGKEGVSEEGEESEGEGETTPPGDNAPAEEPEEDEE